MSRKDKKKKKDIPPEAIEAIEESCPVCKCETIEEKAAAIAEAIVPPEPEPKKEINAGWHAGNFDDPKALVAFFNELDSLGFNVCSADFEYPRMGGITVIYKIKKVE